MVALRLRRRWLAMVLWDRWPWWDLASVVVLLGVVAWSWLSPSFERHRGLAFGGVLLVAVYLVLPFGIRGSFYADMRLLPLILTVLLVSARPAPQVSERMFGALMLGALVFVGARLAGNAVSQRLWGEKTEKTLAMLDAIPRGAALVTLYVKPCAADDATNPERRAHLGGYALARRHAFDNGQFILPGGQLLTVHNPAAGAFEHSNVLATSLTPCPDTQLLSDMVGRIPATMPWLWVIGLDPRTQLPGWRTMATSDDAIVFRRP